MQVYRDDALEMPRPQSAATAYPTAWVLIWRSNGSKPVTMWKPVAPAGYRPLGTVIVSRPDQPKLEQALCVRADLVEPSSSFEAPIWVHRPPELNQVGFPLGQGHAALPDKLFCRHVDILMAVLVDLMPNNTNLCSSKPRLYSSISCSGEQRKRTLYGATPDQLCPCCMLRVPKGWSDAKAAGLNVICTYRGLSCSSCCPVLPCQCFVQISLRKSQDSTLCMCTFWSTKACVDHSIGDASEPFSGMHPIAIATDSIEDHVWLRFQLKYHSSAQAVHCSCD